MQENLINSQEVVEWERIHKDEFVKMIIKDEFLKVILMLIIEQIIIVEGKNLDPAEIFNQIRVKIENIDGNKHLKHDKEINITSKIASLESQVFAQ